MLQGAVRDRLAKKLTPKKAVVSPKERITAAFEAGSATATLDLLVVPPSLGIQNSCWLGIRPDLTAWLAVRHHALKQLRTEDTTRLVAFASQAEAEAFCLGLGLGALPPAQFLVFTRPPLWWWLSKGHRNVPRHQRRSTWRWCW